MIEPPVERVRLSQTAKDQLSKLKRQTRIDRWNVLCRWAVCRSLAEPSPPSPVQITTDSNVEMTWRIFAGDDGDAYAIALKQRCHQDNLPTDPETLAQQFLLHLHRGIGYLAGDRNLKQIEDFVSLVKS
jgi:DNA sulfur modification protein DndE